MGITRTTTDAEVSANIQLMIERKLKRARTALQYVGESAVKEARQGHTYKDQTGNLTSSMGYAIVEDGKVSGVSDFKPITTEGKEGSEKGKSYALSLVDKVNTKFGLIVVAGMEYAAAVATKRNVLQSSRITAEILMNRFFRKKT